MSRHKIVIPEIIKKELDRTGLRYHVTMGKKHAKIFLNDRFVGVFHNSRKDTCAGRGGLNVRSQIRRMCAELSAGGVKPSHADGRKSVG